MPKTRSRSIPAELREPGEPTIEQRADAIYRWAVETCHQHDRFARVLESSADLVEVRAAQELVHLCDETLCTMLKAYEKAAADAKPDGAPEWWHKANALWHAGREYVRRHDGCDRASRSLALHSPEALGELHIRYELEASALLALRHAADAYCRARPQTSGHES